MGVLRARVRRLRPDRTGALVAAAVIVVEVALAAAYATSPLVPAVTDPLTFAFVLAQPFVWIDVAVLAVLTTDPPVATPRRRRLGLLVGAGYLVLLAYFGGLFAAGTGTGGARILWQLPPGYSPLVFYDGAVLALSVEPYKLVGYAALAYLVFVTVLDAAGSAVSGVVGLLSCVSCTWPIVGTIAAGVFGGSSALAAAALDQAYPLSTLVFLSAVALLWWRPGFGGVGPSDDPAD